MNKTKLEFPLEYNELLEYFDAHNAGNDTADKNAILSKLLRKYDVKDFYILLVGLALRYFF